ncbi:histidine phosphatase family protein [Cellulomonas dongxiuzhuiae]|uniref:Histidine phosphatase family protein n=1 Tax=Cellulomonas dongxiuzhuiae TaxID=2819979 RepID=A0ABX8GN00_9CELL|nr:histidine phosphatase family protein [Cellulomonas dongxiuzhuiae]MBO3095648.1 histidine phosphatase family protein [Cellulomonas dongxiuzhuiae]QWC16609.1 histidine phosphatase family protein [Cellulomonas dongxiuzhuiae]
MTLTMTLVRHGRTHFNARRILQGRCDSPLTRDGRAGVRATARHLASTPFTAAWASPSGRAVATAVELLRHHAEVPLRTDSGLLEYAFGIYEQRPEHVLDEVVAWPDLVDDVLAGTHPGLPGGEPGADFMDRTRDVFARIARTHADGHVLVVGHGLALGAYLATVDEVGLVPLPNASVSTVEVAADGTARITSLAVDVAGQGHVAARPMRTPTPVGSVA